MREIAQYYSAKS